MTLRFSRFSPSFLVVAIGLVSTLFPATTAHAGATRTGATFAVGAGARFPDAAFDPANNVYFVIWGRLSGSIGGRFVAPDGTPLGAAFRIPTVGDWAETGRVAYSPDTGGFLVTWLDTRANANFGQVWGRLVAYSAGGSPTFLTSDFMIAAAPGGARPGTAPAVAYATTSKAFLVTWQQAGSNRFDIRAQRVSNAGALLGSEIVITNDADWQDTPTVVYNSALDEFFVVWIHYDTIARLQSRRVTAGTGALPTAPVTIDTGSLLAAPEVQFDPVRNVYLVAWYSDGGPSARIEYARFMSSDGTTGAAKFPVGVGYVSYDGLGMARNTASGVYFVIFNGTGTESVGAEVSTTGTPGSVIQVTATGSPLGNFGPRVTTSATAREWLAVVATGYTTASAQRLATDAPLISGSGSPPAPAPVPAPTPSPTPSPNPTPTPTLHTLSIQRGGSGTVTGSGINCGGSCSAQFAAGTQIILTPSPAAGFVFAGWTGDNDCFDGIIDIVGATSCVAHFTRDQGSASRRVADPNGDAVGDLFLHNQTTGVWYIAHGDVDGFNYSRGNWSRDWVVRAANLNSDDLTDYVLYNTTTGDWIQARSNGTGGFNYTGGTWSIGWQMLVGRFNQDAFDDIFLYNPGNGTWAEVWTDGTGGISQTFSGTWDTGWQMFVARLDLNPADDVFLFKSDGTWVRAFSTGGGGFTYNSGRWDAGYDAKIADTSGDGVDDVFLYRSSDGAWMTAQNTVSGWVYHSGQWSTGWRVSIASLNRDSRDDIFLYNPTSGLWSSAQSDGTGDFFGYFGGQFDAGWDVYVTDFNVDQVHDLFVYNPRTGAWAKCFSNHAGGFTSFTTGLWSPDWTIVAGR